MLDDLLIFDEIDEEKTIETVKKLLGNYHSIRRVARSNTPNITSSYSITPRSETNRISNSTSDAFEKKEKYKTLLDDIHKAINCLESESRKLLYHRYLSEDERFDYELYTDMMISRNTFYRRLAKAQVHFAEAFQGRMLLVYKEDAENELLNSLLEK